MYSSLLLYYRYIYISYYLLLTKKMFKIWDKVMIKSREQMEKEFELDKFWHIDKIPFSKSMKHLCWRTAEISEVSYEIINLVNRDNEEATNFIFTTDMIELVEPERTPTPWEIIEVSNDNKERRRWYYINTWDDWVMVTDILYYKNFMRSIQTKQIYTIEATEEQYKKIQEILS